MYKVPVTVLLVVINVRVLQSRCPKKSKRCDDNALNKPCPQKRKIDIDSSTDNTALPCQKR